jgi:hypothetical protein
MTPLTFLIIVLLCILIYFYLPISYLVQICQATFAQTDKGKHADAEKSAFGAARDALAQSALSLVAGRLRDPSRGLECIVPGMLFACVAFAILLSIDSEARSRNN